MRNSEAEQSRSDLFLLRLWTDEANDPPPGTQYALRSIESSHSRHGRLLHVYSGEGHNFDDWQELVGILEEMLAASGQPSLSDTQPASWRDAEK